MPLATVASFSTVGEAEAARSALDAAELFVHLDDENLVAMQWLYSQAIGGIKVRVRHEDREEAEQLLVTAAADVPQDASAADEAIDTETPAPDVAPVPQCPACEGVDVIYIPRLKLFGMFSILFYGIGVAVNQPELALAGIVAAGLIIAFVEPYRCRTCGERWSGSFSEVRREQAPPLPEPADTIGLPCPRCGTPELHYIRYRRLKVIPLLFSPTAVVVVPIWLLLPKKRCDHCSALVWL
jgi:hypothetical protein